MTENTNKWLKPEEALSRFKKPENAFISQPDYFFTEQATRYGFVIENIGFLIAEDTLSEVVKNSKIYPIPHTQAWMRGLINLRGNLVPVYDFPLLLGLSENKTQYNNLLVLGKENYSVGLLIDNAPRSYDIGDWKKLEEVPYQLAGLEKHYTDAYSYNGIIWIGFNHKDYFKSIKERVVI